MISAIPTISRLEKKNHMILSTDAEKAFDRIWRQFMTETLGKLGIQGDFPSLIKSIYKNPTANIMVEKKMLSS